MSKKCLARFISPALELAPANGTEAPTALDTHTKVLTPQVEAILENDDGRMDMSNPGLANTADGQPKRPPQAFFLFFREKRAEVCKAHPDFAVTEIGKEVGKMWKSLSSVEQQAYKDASAAATKEYQQQMKQYLEAHPSQPKKSKKKNAAKLAEKHGSKAEVAKPVPPKRPCNFLGFFQNDEAPNVKKLKPTLTSKELSAEILALWSKLSAEQQQVYKARATEDKERYAKEMAAFKRQYPDWNKRKQDPAAHTGVDGASSSNGALPGPPQPNQVHISDAAVIDAAAFVWFAKEKREELSRKGTHGRDAAIRVAEMWKDLPMGSQEEFKALAQKASEVLQEAERIVAARDAIQLSGSR